MSENQRAPYRPEIRPLLERTDPPDPGRVLMSRGRWRIPKAQRPVIRIPEESDHRISYGSLVRAKRPPAKILTREQMAEYAKRGGRATGRVARRNTSIGAAEGANNGNNLRKISP